jgi:hypothetical protein
VSAETWDKLKRGELAGARRVDLSCGLTEFPRELFDLADTLEILNLSGNALAQLPADLHRFKHLKILFCSQNAFQHVPPCIAECPELRMVGFKSNQIEQVDSEALGKQLRWLILTDNRITQLPASIGHCTGLQKLMLSGNRLQSLPEELASCEAIELLRLAANDLPRLPEGVLELPRLAWLAFSGNPCSAVRGADPRRILWSELTVGEVLGRGASGIIHAARWNGEEVAVKLFHAAMTSDGLPAWEMQAGLAAGDHPALVSTLGEVSDGPSEAMVMKRVPADWTNLAGPPDFETCTRDVYSDDVAFTAELGRSLLSSIESAAEHLHSRGVLHGDLYAHNILHDGLGQAVLGDFGGATRYEPGSRLGTRLEKIEARALEVLRAEIEARTLA